MCLLRNGGFRRGYVGVGGSVTVSNQITSFFFILRIRTYRCQALFVDRVAPTAPRTHTNADPVAAGRQITRMQ